MVDLETRPSGLVVPRKPARLKQYILTKGTHRYPNPEYVEGESQPSESHIVAQAGDTVLLTDDAFEAFKDLGKFTLHEKADSKKAA